MEKVKIGETPIEEVVKEELVVEETDENREMVSTEEVTQESPDEEPGLEAEKKSVHSDLSESTRRKAIAGLKNVSSSTADITSEVTGVSAAIVGGLDPNKARLIAREPDGNTNSIDTSDSILKLKGSTSKGHSIDRVLAERLDQLSASSIMNTPSGTYKRIVECRKNYFMGQRLPILNQSNALFVDDVNNGSYRGSDIDDTTRYEITRDGQKVTESAEIKAIVDIINPKGVETLYREQRTHLDIDRETDILARRDGYSFVRLISNKDAVKEMYIKYILKTKKQQRNETTKKAKITTESVHCLKNPSDIKYLLKNYQISLESVNTGEFILERVMTNEQIEDAKKNIKLLNETRSSMETEEGKIDISKYEANEYQIKETFEEFAYRYLTGGCEHVYSVPYTKKLSDKKGIGDDIAWEFPYGENFSFSYNAIGVEDGMAIYNELFVDNRIQTSRYISTESVDDSINRLEERIPEELLSALEECSFEDIYSLSGRTIGANSSVISCESLMDAAVATSVGRSPLEELFVRTMRSEMIGWDNKNYGIEAIADIDLFENIVKNQMVPALEDGVRVDAFQPVGAPQQDFDTKNSDDNLEKSISEKNALYSKLERMFGHIKGETVEVLDNTRVVPLMAVNRLLGVFYTLYSHYDIQHLIAVRSVVMNPMAYSQNMDMLDLDKEEHEETLGRLLFADTIKPLIERHMDTKFLKDNADIIYILKKLMEENEISHQKMYHDITRFNMYNMSKIIFIPASSLIFKRNGQSGLGVSTFTQAATPANARILCDEAFLSHYLFDAKGISIVTAPKGTAGNGNEYGTGTVAQELKNLMVNRSDMLDMGAYDFQLTHKIVVLLKEEGSNATVDVQSLQFPDFEIDFQLMDRWDQTATGQIGYSSALFTSSNDGSNTELARKLYELDNTKTLEILAAQQNKLKASSQLATGLLRMRGGSKYDNYMITWRPPDVDRGNRIIGTEKIQEITAYVEGVFNLAAGIYEGDTDFEASKKYVKLGILDGVKVADKNIADLKGIVEKAIKQAKVNVAANVKERDSETGEITEKFEDATPIEE